MAVICGTYPLKRLINIVSVIILLILLMPLFSIILVLIYLSTPGPLFCKQTKLERLSKLFTMCQFCSMYLDADDLL
ncbi:sugar transferase [Methylobacter sp. S3L5C]|nr:sugar transferase [Methylobacter sp. S3L5C]